MRGTGPDRPVTNLPTPATPARTTADRTNLGDNVRVAVEQGHATLPAVHRPMLGQRRLLLRAAARPCPADRPKPGRRDRSRWRERARVPVGVRLGTGDYRSKPDASHDHRRGCSRANTQVVGAASRFGTVQALRLVRARGRRPLPARPGRDRTSRRTVDHPAGPQPADGSRRARRSVFGLSSAIGLASSRPRSTRSWRTQELRWSRSRRSVHALTAMPSASC